MDVFNYILDAINSIGTFLIGITVVIGIPKIIGNLSIKNETLYGDEAKERYNQIKEKLKKSSNIELQTIEYGGGDIIVPRFELSKISYNPKTMGDNWKRCKAIIKFYDKDNENKIITQRWLIK